MGESKIEWTEQTWNPVVGCTIVSPGCTNCYAMRDAWRKHHIKALPHYHGLTKKVKNSPVWTGKLALAPDSILLAPLKRKKPTMYFVNSMGDLFHEDCPDEWIDPVFAVMALTPWHTYQVLTKRAGRMREYLSDTRVAAIGRDLCTRIADQMIDVDLTGERSANLTPRQIREMLPLPNVWLGVSCERQPEYDERKEHLRNTPAAVHFFSFEPLLGPINADYLGEWAIVGGESGPKARPMHPDWARGLRDQCAAAGVAFFFKQWGEHLPWSQFNEAPHIVDDPEATRFLTSEWRNGKWNDVGRPIWSDSADGDIDGQQCVARVGKKAAGRLLDGVEHNAFPAGRA